MSEPRPRPPDEIQAKYPRGTEAGLVHRPVGAVSDELVAPAATGVRRPIYVEFYSNEEALDRGQSCLDGPT
jgi:hypothetical protein